MDAIHINWTKPFRNRFNAPYEVEDFEILTTILSALKWREKNGNIKMVTDSVGAQYYKKTGLDVIWNSVENILDNVDVNSNVFWAAGKIFALKKQNAPVAMIDTDFIVWERIDEEKLADVSVIHFENLYPDVYPPKDFFHMDNYEFDNDFDWNIKACNTAFCVIKNEKLLRYYTDKSIEFMRHTSEQNDRLAYMVFAEQRMLPMCAKKLNMSIMSFSDLNKLFKNGDNMFTHTWGMKQQMRDNAFLRADFCRRCIKRIIKYYYEYRKSETVFLKYCFFVHTINIFTIQKNGDYYGIYKNYTYISRLNHRIVFLNKNNRQQANVGIEYVRLYKRYNYRLYRRRNGDFA